MSIHYEDDSVVLHHGDCLEVMRTLPDASVDAVVTDPPYGLGFMGREWDSLPPGEPWARECLRVLKPGGHLLAFGGTRTWHRLACAVEDAGFEVRDSIAWLYGSGFPKSLDVSKAINKAAGAEREVVGASPYAARKPNGSAGVDSVGLSSTPGLDVTAPATPEAAKWAGWGTALKPAFEPVVVARKPLAGNVAANVLAHGTGALNIDATRIETTDKLGGGANKGMTAETRHEGFARPWMRDDGLREAAAERSRDNTARAESLGRWPTNVLLDDSQAAELDRQSGETVSKSGGVAGWQDEYVGGTYKPIERTGHDDQGGASRFFPTFRYEAKAPKSERPKVNGIAHNTVKPLDLMRWLVRLVTPPGGTVLEPFAGSGTTVEACVVEGFRCVAIEKTDEYLPLITQRINRQRDPVAYMQAAGDDLGLFDLEEDTA